MAQFDVVRKISIELEKRGIIKPSEWMVLTSGDHMGINGGTNNIKIIQASLSTNQYTTEVEASPTRPMPMTYRHKPVRI